MIAEARHGQSPSRDGGLDRLHVHGHGAGSTLVVVAFAIAMMGTTLPTPLYPLYEREFHLAPVLTPVIFASYAVGVIGALLFLGYLSDEIGRRRMMLPALVLSAMSAATFLLADGLAALLLGRVLSGLSSGIASGAATAWLVDLAGKEKKQRATMLAVGANLGGLSVGPLLSGALASFGPSPLRSPFVVDLVLLVPAAIGVMAAPETVKVARPHVHLRMQAMRVPSEVKDLFPRAAVAGVCAFAVAGVFNAVAPGFLGKELSHPRPIESGLLVFLFFATAAAGQVVVDRLPKRVGLGIGCGVLIAGLAALALALATHSTALLFVSGAASGLGQGMAVGFGLAGINERLGDKKGETDSAYFVLLYLGVALPVIGVGFAVPAIGMITAGLIFCGVVGASVLVVLLTMGKKGSQ
jgi:MFS family permease